MKRCPACDCGFEADDWTCPRCRFSVPVDQGRLVFAPELARRSEGFRAEYFQMLAPLEAGNFWFRARNRLIVWALRRYYPDAASLLEIGCGTGYVLAGIASALPTLRLSGSEIYSNALGFAASRVPGATLFQMDARRIPFENEFAVVGAFDVLEHIVEDEMVLAQMHRAVAQGGGILLTVPQHPFLWSRQDEAACHVRRYDVTELTEKVRRAGFTVQRATSFVSLLLPLMLASRWRKRNPDVKFDVLDELRIAGAVNTALEATLGVERALIRAGLSFPLGGSLLVVARKA